jgi:hypothetical protein
MSAYQYNETVYSYHGRQEDIQFIEEGSIV